MKKLLLSLILRTAQFRVAVYNWWYYVKQRDFKSARNAFITHMTLDLDSVVYDLDLKLMWKDNPTPPHFVTPMGNHEFKVAVIYKNVIHSFHKIPGVPSFPPQECNS